MSAAFVPAPAACPFAYLHRLSWRNRRCPAANASLAGASTNPDHLARHPKNGRIVRSVAVRPRSGGNGTLWYTMSSLISALQASRSFAQPAARNVSTTSIELRAERVWIWGFCMPARFALLALKRSVLMRWRSNRLWGVSVMAGPWWWAACAADVVVSDAARRTDVKNEPLTASVRELSELPFEPLHVSGRDAGYSARVGNVSAWVFGDTFSTTTPPDGSSLSSTWSWTQDLSAEDGAIGPFMQPPDTTDPADPSGAPAQFLPYDPAGYEIAFNLLHACRPGYEALGPECPCDAADDRCGDRFALWPGPVITYRDAAGGERALVLYTELFVHAGSAYDYTIRGTSIARWDDPRQPAVRSAVPVFGPDDAHPTAGAVRFTVGGTEYLYAYACQPKPDDLVANCSVARAPFLRAPNDPLGSILNRADWRFYTGGDLDSDSSWNVSAANASDLSSSAVAEDASSRGSGARVFRVGFRFA